MLTRRILPKHWVWKGNLRHHKRNMPLLNFRHQSIERSPAALSNWELLSVSNKLPRNAQTTCRSVVRDDWLQLEILDLATVMVQLVWRTAIFQNSAIRFGALFLVLWWFFLAFFWLVIRFIGIWWVMFSFLFLRMIAFRIWWVILVFSPFLFWMRFFLLVSSLCWVIRIGRKWRGFTFLSFWFQFDLWDIDLFIAIWGIRTRTANIQHNILRSINFDEITAFKRQMSWVSAFFAASSSSFLVLVCQPRNKVLFARYHD